MGKNCSVCGTINNDDATQCSHCSHNFTHRAAQSVAPPPPNTPPYPIYLPHNIDPPPPDLPRRRFSPILVVICSLLVGIIVGAGGYWIINRPPSSHSNDPNVVKYVSDTNPTTYIGIIHHATITGTTYNPDTPPGGIPSAPHYHCTASYAVTSDTDLQVEVFWDRDYPSIKTNSADVFNTCQRYQENSGDPEQGKPVTLVVTGIRDSSQSVFRNILFIIPEDQ